jgi:predicted RecB family endonuclease
MFYIGSCRRSSLPSGEGRWRSSERIAARILEEAGFRVLEEHDRVMINGVEVGEIDLVAEKEGQRYAVEVKAGRLDVGGVRQAYVNAGLIGAKPLVICKGFSDSAAEALAQELGVEVLRLSDLFVIDQEELEVLMREVIEDVVEDLISYLTSEVKPTEEDVSVLRAIVETSDILEAAGKLGKDVGDLARTIEGLRSKGVLPKWARKYSSVKRTAEIALARDKLREAVGALRGTGSTV